MHTSKAVALLTILVFMSWPKLISAEDKEFYEYGAVEELRSAKEFYVDAGADLDLRDIIKSRLEAIAGVKVVERPEDAHYWVIFRWTGGAEYFGRTIVLANPSSAHPRLLFTDRSSKTDLSELADVSGRSLAKAYRRASGKPSAG